MLATVLTLHTPSGFYAIHTQTGIATFAYPTSTYWTQAKRSPIATARAMLEPELAFRANWPDHWPPTQATMLERDARMANVVNGDARTERTTMIMNS